MPAAIGQRPSSSATGEMKGGLGRLTTPRVRGTGNKSYTQKCGGGPVAERGLSRDKASLS